MCEVRYVSQDCIGEIRVRKFKRGKRACDNCGQTYQRRNQLEAWTSQNPGSRTGWSKTIQRVCVHCQNADLAASVVRAIMVRTTTRKGVKA